MADKDFIERTTTKPGEMIITPPKKAPKKTYMDVPPDVTEEQALAIGRQLYDKIPNKPRRGK